MKNDKKIAVILFNLGAPDNMKAVEPFLFNLFFDKHIIRLPFIFRFLLAVLISKKRAKTASEIYEMMGGKSPLFANTLKQAKSLEKNLQDLGKFKCFIAMRYWHPMSMEVAKAVKAWNPDEIILLPLYPQFSTTTTLSSFREWQKACNKINFKKPTYRLCCYPKNSGFINAAAKLLEDSLKKIKDKKNYRILFTAHGLPKKIIKDGDPYQWQIEQTVEAIINQIKNIPESIICYQSRVGRMEWIKPYTEDEIIRAGMQGKSIIIVPVAFVSEHSETLVELDHEYYELAKENHVKNYIRVTTVSEDKKFILGLKAEIKNIIDKKQPLNRSIENVSCPESFVDCACRKQDLTQ